MEAAVERSFFVAPEEVEEEPEPAPIDEPKERGWPWRRQKKAQSGEPIVLAEPVAPEPVEPEPVSFEPDLVQPAASVAGSEVLPSAPSAEPAESIPPSLADLPAEPAPSPQAAETTSAPPPVAQQRFVDWPKQPEGGANVMPMPPPIEVITPLPVEAMAAEAPALGMIAQPAAEPEAGASAGKVPCSRCGQPSERGLCEACLDAIAELRQLSAQFGM